MILEYRETVKGIEVLREWSAKRMEFLNDYVESNLSEENYIESIVNLCNGKKSPVSKRTLQTMIDYEKKYINSLLEELNENESKINDLVYFCRTGKYPMQMENIRIVIKMVFAD